MSNVEVNDFTFDIFYFFTSTFNMLHSIFKIVIRQAIAGQTFW
jgi:hypothetical protein